MGDHPRVGGEKLSYSVISIFREGSPPRGRGKVKVQIAQGPKMGITPAWAGKRPHTCGPCAAQEDHPRVGGEKAFLFSRGAPPWGSPPRGRGKDAVLVAALLHDRITPAWAGKRRCTARREPASRDHPRVGGEKLPSIISCIVQPGSPPRGRGKGLFSTIPGGCPGITPAWAGKSKGV